MEPKDTPHARVRARDAGMRLLTRLTTGAAVSAVIGVGLFGAVSAYTIPGTATTSTITSSSSSTSTSSGLQSSTTPVTSSSSSGVSVSGGSR